jgi:hypothetical protein
MMTLISQNWNNEIIQGFELREKNCVWKSDTNHEPEINFLNYGGFCKLYFGFKKENFDSIKIYS